MATDDKDNELLARVLRRGANKMLMGNEIKALRKCAEAMRYALDQMLIRLDQLETSLDEDSK